LSHAREVCRATIQRVRVRGSWKKRTDIIKRAFRLTGDKTGP